MSDYLKAVEEFREFYRIASRKECVEPGCLREPYARGRCEMHHKRLERRGTHQPSDKNMRLGQTHVFVAETLLKQTDECIRWPYQSTTCGYPIFRFKNVNLRVSRFICFAAHGTPADMEMHAAHECGKGHEGCINPRHLTWKTAKDNMADKVIHGTEMIGEKHHNARLTETQVVEIRSLRGKVTRKKMAVLFGVGRATIDNVIDRATWRHVA